MCIQNQNQAKISLEIDLGWQYLPAPGRSKHNPTWEKVCKPYFKEFLEIRIEEHEFTIKLCETREDQADMSTSQLTTESDSQSYEFVKMSLIH